MKDDNNIFLKGFVVVMLGIITILIIYSGLIDFESIKNNIIVIWIISFFSLKSINWFNILILILLIYTNHRINKITKK